MIRLFSIDDHPVISEGLHYRIEPARDGISLVGSAANVIEAILKANPEDFDIFILDLYIPGSEPHENVRLLKKTFPNKKIIIFTCESSSMWVRSMMKPCSRKAHHLRLFQTDHRII